MSNPQTQLFSLLAESRSRSSDIQQIRQRAAARLPQAEQTLIDRVNALRSTPNAEYLEALEDLSNIRKSIAVNGDVQQSETNSERDPQAV
jgi:ribosome-binding protein aMBF1 (putative translation factor)